MNQRTLATDLKVSAIGLGCMGMPLSDEPKRERKDLEAVNTPEKAT